MGRHYECNGMSLHLLSCAYTRKRVEMVSLLEILPRFCLQLMTIKYSILFAFVFGVHRISKMLFAIRCILLVK